MFGAVSSLGFRLEGCVRRGGVKSKDTYMLYSGQQHAKYASHLELGGPDLLELFAG